MRRSKWVHLNLLLGVCFVLILTAQNTRKDEPFIFSAGQFYTMPIGEPPPGWKPVQAGQGKIIEENGRRFLRLINTSAQYNELMLTTQLPEHWEGVKITAVVRAKNIIPGPENWHVGKIQTLFFSPNKEKLTSGWPCVGECREGDRDWFSSSITLPIPSKEAQLRIQIALYHCIGMYDIEKIELEPAIVWGFSRNTQGKPDCWMREPVENISSYRGRIVLNGPWRFAPFVPGKQKYGEQEWGLIWVPGNWRRTGFAGLAERGKGALWEQFDGNKLATAWYQREIKIPKEWEGQTILLEISRISTDAVVFLNGKECGYIESPFGEVDLSPAVLFGSINDLRILVSASLDRIEDWSLMGIETGQIHQTEAKLTTRGIIGEVFIHSRPAKRFISDIFVQTSVRKKEITLDVELTGIDRASSIPYQIHIIGNSGQTEKLFSGKLSASANTVQTIRLTFPWENPQLWDYRTPNLYTLYFKLDSPEIKDEYSVTFGFREFWIEGRRFFLNGKELRLRPALIPDQYKEEIGNLAYIEGCIQGLIHTGFNFAEFWPWDHDKRGEPHFRWLWAEVADRIGFPISGVVLSVTPYIVDFKTWACIWNEEQKNKWKTRMVRELRKYRNHPSIIMWGTSPNFFGHVQDQNPRLIGKRNYYRKSPTAIAGLEAIEIIKQADPTRPVFTHHGADIGDVHTCNNYLCMIPLQEREEWLSHWSVHGEMPYLAIEFGTPLFVTFHRGRSGYRESTQTEPLYTEWAAAYFGSIAYIREPPEYRNYIAQTFRNDQLYKNFHADSFLLDQPLFQDIQSLFIQNTWRSWRTWGITGGMIPWENRQRWKPISQEEVFMGYFNPGMRGTYFPYLKRTSLRLFSSEYGWETLPSGNALIQNNQETLGWIAGYPQFTEKSHHFFSGTTIQKQIILINDSRKKLPYSGMWEVTLENTLLTKETFQGEIDVASNLFIPIQFKVASSKKSNGRITLNVKIGTATHHDTFHFRVFPVTESYPSSKFPKEKIQLFDPIGETTAMLKGMNIPFVSWNPSSKPNLLIIGRKSLSHTKNFPEGLESFVQNGGRLLILAQDPKWINSAWGFRTARYLARHVFPVSKHHPIYKGLDATDLCNWNGEGTLVEPYPQVTNLNSREPYGWHWGNRGTVASCSIEKPHYTGWTPILECEWDLAYTPLMELTMGKGLVLFCGLDLEDYWNRDPVARMLAYQILEYVLTQPISEKVTQTLCMGETQDFAKLDSLGLIYEKTNQIPKEGKKLLIVGSKLSPPEQLLREFISQGGRVLFLARQTEQGPLGTQFKKVTNFCGSLNVPEWEETRGISISDLRSRSGFETWILESGAIKGADGMLGIQKIDKGIVLFCQIDPDFLNADQKTYLRYTRWRYTRVLSQILTNLGATFAYDSTIWNFHQILSSISLAGEWKAKLVKPLPPAKAENKHKNIFSQEAQAAIIEKDWTNWQPVQVPGIWENYGGQWQGADGEAVFKKIIDIPQEWRGLDLELSLGTLDDFDNCFWNGHLVGGIDSPDAWNRKRIYTIPRNLVKPGPNEITIRIFDHFGGGGFTGHPEELQIRPITKKYLQPYHPDYRQDFELGDDPYRYYRW